MNINLNQEQAGALDAIKAFLLDDTQDAFILRGSAGTGKTTLVAGLVEALDEMKLSCALFGPHGSGSAYFGQQSQANHCKT